MKPGLRWRSTRAAAWLIAGTFLAGAWLLGGALWIPLKAQLAQVLLERAWAQQLRSGEPVPPWPWADTWPVARLRLPAQEVSLLVLQGDSGRSLAFGPGLAAGSDPEGTMLISGHRDTHFAVLRQLRPGDVLELEDRQGLRRYRVTDGAVFDSRLEAIRASREQGELVLLTCYPFEALVPGGPLRYRVHAQLM